jgi:AcrR family transcriptional regulator
MTDSAAPIGLRERKKLATRAALSWATICLVVQHGLDNVKVEDIAAQVGVSPRTFNNYFASKGEAIVARHLDRVMGVAAELRRRPPDEPLWDAILNAVLARFAEDRMSGSQPRVDHERWTAGIRLMMAEPALQSEFIRAGAIAEVELAAVVAERTGTDPQRDLYPRLVAGAIGVAGNVANHHWLHADPPVPLEDVLRQAFAQVAAGLPEPPASPSRTTINPPAHPPADPPCPAPARPARAGRPCAPCAAGTQGVLS